MALFITGCGKQSRTSPESSAQVVTIWAHEGQPEEKQTLQNIVDAFNNTQTGITAKIEFKQEQGYGDRVNAAAISGQLPDILEVDGPYTARFADIGILDPIGTDIPSEMRDDFLDTIISQGTYNGRLYTLGAFDSTVALFYDRALMEECGISPPDKVENAWAWDDFVSALRVIKEKKPDILPLETFMSWGGEWLTYAFTPLMWSNNGQLISEDGTRTSGVLDSNDNIEALTLWQQLFSEGLADVNAPEGQFERGRAAMAWGVFNRWPIYKEAGLDFAMTPLPFFIKPASPSGSWCWGITKQCSNREPAVKVLTWILDPEQGIAPMCRANGGIPARNSAVPLMPDYAATRQLFIDQLNISGRSRPATPGYATLTSELSRALGDIARGSDVKETLARAAKAVDMTLKDK